MKYRFIEAHKQEWPISYLCKALGVSRGGYYKFLKRPEREEGRKQLRQVVQSIAAATRNTYGSRRMRVALHALGYCVSRRTAANLMKECGVKARYKKRYRLTPKRHDHENCFDNIVARDFKPANANTVYVSDITQLGTSAGPFYLAVVIDLYSRRVVGWAMSSRMKATIVCDALTLAIWQRQPAQGLVVHSDRGAQYTSASYRNLLQRHGYVGSMSRPGNCWDNAVSESFFARLKQECLKWHQFKTRKEAYDTILEYITMFYNPSRLHSTLGYKSPNQFEAERLVVGNPQKT